MTTSVKDLLNNAQSIEDLNNKQDDLIKNLRVDLKKILGLPIRPFIKIDPIDGNLTVVTRGVHHLLECELLELKEFLGFETFSLKYSNSSIKINLHDIEEIETLEEVD